MESDLESRLHVIERLTQVFRTERIVYLAITVMAFMALVSCAGALVYKGQAGTPELSMLFGSSGLITYTGGRVLFMWSRALQAVMPTISGEERTHE